MTEYRFHLQKYRPGSKTACPGCGRKSCFTRYIDEAGEISFPDSVGMCDHINSCGYRYTPKEYFRDNPAVKEKLNKRERNSCNPMAARPPARALPERKPQISFLPSDWVEQSMRRYDINPLYRYFTKVMGKENVDKLFSLYRVGTSKRWGGAAVFWQTDRDGNVRAGKIMGYDAVTGHRIKEPFNQVSWVHSVRKVQDFRMKQCLFGEHLLSEDKSRPVALVESEKTAIIASYYLPQFLWIASGGKNGCFNVNSLSVLAGRSVVLFPDLGATDYWQSKISLMKSCGIEVQMFDYLEANATEDERKEGYDIADYLLKVKPGEAILQQMIRKNPVLETLIDTFDLKLISVQQGTPQPKVLPPKKRRFRL